MVILQLSFLFSERTVTKQFFEQLEKSLEGAGIELRSSESRADSVNEYVFYSKVILLTLNKLR